MANNYSYDFSPKAERDLDETLLYVEQELSNPKAARDFVTELFKQIDNIRKFPNSGREIDNEFVSDPTLRKFFVGKYTVVYKPIIETELIIIVRIIYGGRNINEMLKSL